MAPFTNGYYPGNYDPDHKEPNPGPLPENKKPGYYPPSSDSGSSSPTTKVDVVALLKPQAEKYLKPRKIPCSGEELIKKNVDQVNIQMLKNLLGIKHNTNINDSSTTDFIIEDLVKQNEMDNTGRYGEGPCLFRSLVAAAEIFTSKKMSLDQLNNLAATMNKSKNELGTTIVAKDCTVAQGDGPEIIIKAALDILVGDNDYQITVDTEKIDGAQYTIRDWVVHYQLGGEKGDLLFEPVRSSKNASRAGAAPHTKYYIRIREVN